MDAQKQLRDDIVLIFSYMVLLFISIFIPVFFLFALFILPIPLIIYAVDHERKRLLMMIGVLAVFVSILGLILQTTLFIPLFVTSVASGLAIGTAIKKKQSAYETWIWGTVGYIIGLLFIFVFTQYILEINWAEEIRVAINRSIDNIQSVIVGIDSEITHQVEKQFDLMKEQLFYIPNLIPAGIAISSIVFALITQWLSYKIINRKGRKLLRFPPIQKLDFPRAIFWIFILAFFLMLMDNDPTSDLFIVGQNVSSLMSFLIILQGFTFIFFFAHYRKQSNTLPIIIVVASVILSPLLYVVRLVGLLDLVLSLRKRMEGSQKDRG